ncbi:hypothetical protein HDU97_009389 [Phlyctochytrium planicorne]|nr:hypothetical protein HDU97_009389 [Phlyctochytrium planicorne]
MAKDYEDMGLILGMRASTLESYLKNNITSLTVVQIKSVLQYLTRKFQLPTQTKYLKRQWVDYLEGILFKSKTAAPVIASVGSPFNVTFSAANPSTPTTPLVSIGSSLTQKTPLTPAPSSTWFARPTLAAQTPGSGLPPQSTAKISPIAPSVPVFRSSSGEKPDPPPSGLSAVPDSRSLSREKPPVAAPFPGSGLPATPTPVASASCFSLSANPNKSAPALTIAPIAPKAPAKAATPSVPKVNFPMVVYQKNDSAVLSGIYNNLRNLSADFCHYFDFRGFFNGVHLNKKEHAEIYVTISAKHLRRLRSSQMSSNIPLGGIIRILLILFSGPNKHFLASDFKITIRTQDSTGAFVVPNRNNDIYPFVDLTPGLFLLPPTVLKKGKEEGLRCVIRIQPYSGYKKLDIYAGVFSVTQLDINQRIAKIYESYVEKKASDRTATKTKNPVPPYLSIQTPAKSNPAPSSTNPPNAQPNVAPQTSNARPLDGIASPIGLGYSTPLRSNSLNAPISAAGTPSPFVESTPQKYGPAPVFATLAPRPPPALSSKAPLAVTPAQLAPKRDLVALREKALEIFSKVSYEAKKNSSCNAGDVEIGDSIITFTCPVSLSRITDPVKGENCKHLQCFDLRPFLDMLYLKLWKCSVCGAHLRADSLVVDLPSLQLLQKYPNADRCVVKSDGTDAPFDKYADEPKPMKNVDAPKPSQTVAVVDLFDDDDVIEVDQVEGGGNSGATGGDNVGGGAKRKAAGVVDLDEIGSNGAESSNKRVRSPPKRSVEGGAIAPRILLIEID